MSGPIEGRPLTSYHSLSRAGVSARALAPVCASREIKIHVFPQLAATGRSSVERRPLLKGG